MASQSLDILAGLAKNLSNPKAIIFYVRFSVIFIWPN